MTAVALVVAGAAFVAGLALGLRNWRWSIYGLLAYVPISGIPLDVTYGHRLQRAVAVLAIDFVFVLPAYVGFAFWAWPRRRRLTFRGIPFVAVGALGLVVLVQGFNPRLPSHLLGLIGIKVWLFYIPLLAVGYHLVRTRKELHRLVTSIALLAVVPAVIGVAEAALLYSGHGDTVYSVYGHAAGAVTQQYTALVLAGGGNLKRIPSTFSSFYQYYLFLAVSIAAGYAWWRRARATSWEGAAAAAVLVLLAVASCLTGVRAAFFMTPLLLVLMVALEGRAAVRFVARALVPVAVVLALATAVPATRLLDAWKTGAHTVRVEFGDVIVSSGRQAFHATRLGLGAGVDSVGGRYAYSSEGSWNRAVFPVLHGDFVESWWLRAYVELGIVGIVAVIALFGLLLVRGYRAHASLRDAGLRACSAAFLAVAIWTTVYDVKAQYLDLTPLNVYFWLFAGILLGLPELERRRGAAAETAAEPVAGEVPVAAER